MMLHGLCALAVFVLSYSHKTARPKHDFFNTANDTSSGICHAEYFHCNGAAGAIVVSQSYKGRLFGSGCLQR